MMLSASSLAIHNHQDSSILLIQYLRSRRSLSPPSYPSSGIIDNSYNTHNVQQPNAATYNQHDDIFILSEGDKTKTKQIPSNSTMYMMMQCQSLPNDIDSNLLCANQICVVSDTKAHPISSVGVDPFIQHHDMNHNNYLNNDHAMIVFGMTIIIIILTILSMMVV